MKEREFLNLVCRDPFLRNFIPSLDVLHFIACQFALESDFGRSNLAKFNNNFCGMKYPHRRFSFASYDGVFAKYDTFSHCVKDYLVWVFFNRPYQNTLFSLDSFKRFLRDCCYCPDNDYILKIEKIYFKYYGCNSETTPCE